MRLAIEVRQAGPLGNLPRNEEEVLFPVIPFIYSVPQVGLDANCFTSSLSGAVVADRTRLIPKVSFPYT